MRTAEYQAMYEVEDGHWWYTGMRRILDALVRHRFSERYGSLQVLDAGCGTGGNSAYLRRYGEVSGFDFSDEALRFARQRPGLTLARASVDHIPFRDGCFDLVLSNDVLCHLSVADEQQAVREFARVLRPGGLLYLQLPAFDRLRSHHDVAVHTKHRFTGDEVRNLLRGGGLRVRRVTYANALLFPAAAGWRMLNKGKDHEQIEQSDVHPVPRVVNTVLRTALSLEAPVLRRRRLPFGLSVIGVAEKRGQI